MTRQEAAKELLYYFPAGVGDWPRHNYRPTIRTFQVRNDGHAGETRRANAGAIALRDACNVFGLAWYNGDTGEAVNGATVNADACNAAQSEINRYRFRIGEIGE